jgi:tRNA1(Val) A37 N6-methylase TrmN6
MTEDLFGWIRTARHHGAGRPVVADRPAQSIADIIDACGRRSAGEVTPVYPRAGENAVRILVTAIRARGQAEPARAAPHARRSGKYKFSALVDDLNNGRATPPRAMIFKPAIVLWCRILHLGAT